MSGANLSCLLHIVDFLLDPAQRQKEFYVNFSEKRDNIIPPSWDWINTDANEASVQCGIGTEEKCFVWFYRARYDQYYVYVEYVGPVCYLFFEELAISINEQFLSNLQ